MISSRAQLIPRPHVYRRRNKPIYGITFHTTGSDPVLRHGAKTPLQFTVDYYRSKHGPTYVIDWDGSLWATTADEATRTTNVWIKPSERAAMQDGTWTKLLSPAALAQWRARWPGARSPLDIMPPGVHPGESYIAVEMIPIRVGSTIYGGQTPAYDGSYFTRAQHETAAALAVDVGRRYRFPRGWEKTSRLVGHEDLNPIRRHIRAGMWDPGWSRTPRHFSLPWLQAQIAGASTSSRVKGAAIAGVIALAAAGAAYLVFRPRRN